MFVGFLEILGCICLLKAVYNAIVSMSFNPIYRGVRVRDSRSMSESSSSSVSTETQQQQKRRSPAQNGGYEGIHADRKGAGGRKKRKTKRAHARNGKRKGECIAPDALRTESDETYKRLKCMQIAADGDEEPNREEEGGRVKVAAKETLSREPIEVEGLCVACKREQVHSSVTCSVQMCTDVVVACADCEYSFPKLVGFLLLNPHCSAHSRLAEYAALPPECVVEGCRVSVQNWAGSEEYQCEEKDHPPAIRTLRIPTWEHTRTSIRNWLQDNEFTVESHAPGISKSEAVQKARRRQRGSSAHGAARKAIQSARVQTMLNGFNFDVDHWKVDDFSEEDASALVVYALTGERMNRLWRVVVPGMLKGEVRIPACKTTFCVYCKSVKPKGGDAAWSTKMLMNSRVLVCREAKCQQDHDTLSSVASIETSSHVDRDERPDDVSAKVMHMLSTGARKWLQFQ